MVEVGGALRSYVASGHELLDGYGAQERCTAARGQSLIPWPNRLRDGRYSFDGEEHQLPLTEPAKHNAIHGLVRWANWSAAVAGGGPRHHGATSCTPSPAGRSRSPWRSSIACPATA